MDHLIRDKLGLYGFFVVVREKLEKVGKKTNRLFVTRANRILMETFDVMNK